MHNPVFKKAIDQAASKIGITTSHFPTNWAISLIKNNNTKFIVGNTLPLNNVTAYRVARSKNLCHEILTKSGIMSVPHKLILTPTTLINRKTNVGNTKLIADFISENGFPFLIKRNNSSKGDGVFFIQNEVELENTLSLVYTVDSTLCFSPYRKIVSEYRNVVLDDECLLSYEKQIPYIIGNGKSMIIELVAEYLKKNENTKESPDKLFEEPLMKRLNEIPQKNEKIFLHRKHNATFGTTYKIVTNNSMKLMAIAAAQAINARFVSVDIIHSETYNFEVLEINASVVLNAFSAASTRNFKLTVEIFRRALEKAFL